MLNWLLSKLRKKPSDSVTPKSTPESAQPKAESKPADKVAAPVEAAAPPVSEKVTSTPEPVKPVSQTVESPVVNATPKVASAVENSNVPQDSMLRRHYLTNLRAIITALNPAHPTDSALSRHYEAQIAAKIEQCVSNEAAMAQLLSDYETYKKTPAPVAVAVVKEEPVSIATTPEIKTVSEEPQTVAVKEEAPVIIEPVIAKTENVAVATPHKASKIPQDSTLRRHYRTHLSAQIQANLPARPTDSTLRRHYDALLESEVNKQMSE